MNAHLYSRRELLKKGSAAAAGLLAWGAGPPAWAQFPMKQINVLCTGPAGSIPDIVDLMGGQIRSRRRARPSRWPPASPPSSVTGSR